MMVLPIVVNDEEFDIFIALRDENIDRIRRYDPVQFRQTLMPPGMVGERRVRDIYVGYGDAEDERRVLDMLFRKVDIREVASYLMRGWAWKPEEGDSDAPYLDASSEGPKQ